jgi:hypothetical protein
MRSVGRAALVLALVAVVVLMLAGNVSAALQTAVLTVLPALALAVMMLTRPYLGERVIAELRARRGRRPRAQARRGARRRLDALVPARGGLLIATALAGRAPPSACTVRR